MPSGFRLLKTAHVATAFDGEGARLNGGRWNSPGTAVVYTSQSESLAALEILVHLQASRLLMSCSTIPVVFDGDLVEILDAADLPPGWDGYPAPSALAQIGDRWVVEQRSAVLQVPSAVVPNEVNYVLNPGHPQFARIRIGSPRPFRFDQRLK